MKVILFNLVLVSAAVMVMSAGEYTDKYDNVDLDEILNNQRLYQKYFDCVMGKGKCTPDGLVLKEKIPEALQEECVKCTERQKQGADKVLRFLIREKKEDFKALEQKYDPEGVYQKKYEAQRKQLEGGSR